jgi:hypothetical protein
MQKSTKLILLVLAYLTLMFVDIGFNLLGLIPVIGSAFESVTEIINETLRLVLLGFGAYSLSKK